MKYFLSIAILLMIIPQILFSQSIEYRIPKHSLEQILNAMMKSGKFSYHTINQDPKLPTKFINEHGVVGLITPYLREYSVNIDSCSLNFSESTLEINMPNVDFCFFGKDNKIEVTLFSIPYSGTCTISEELGPAVRRSTNGSISTKPSLLIKNGSGSDPDTLFLSLNNTFASLSQISNFATCEWFIDFNVSAPALDKMPFDSTKVELFTFSKNSKYDYGHAKIAMLPLSEEIVITIPLVATPPVIQVENNLDGNNLVGKVQIKEATASAYTITEQSGFAIYDNLQGEHHAFFRDDNFPSGNSRYRFQSANSISNLKLLRSATIIGTRQVKIIPDSLDTKYSGDYAKQNHLSLNNSFDGVLSASSSMKIDNTLITLPFNDWYFTTKDVTRPYSLELINPQLFGIKWNFTGWSDGVLTNPRSFLFLNDTNLLAEWKGELTSKTGNWVQSQSPYSFNGTSSILYTTPTSNGFPEYYLHQENNGQSWEVKVLDNNFTPVSLAVVDYNKQKSYTGVICKTGGAEDKNIILSQIVNGVKYYSDLAAWGYSDSDPVASVISDQAKIYISPYVNNSGWPQYFNKFLVVIVDGLTVYTRTGLMNSTATQVQSWEPWSSFTVTSTPVVSTNGKTMYITWLQNGNLVGRRYLNSSWGSTYTLYSNSGGNFINFTATVNSTDDLVLMMTRQNSGSQTKSMCFGKRYISGSSAPVTVLETTTYGGFSAYSLAAEGTKLLVSVGKTPDSETPMSYYLWKNDGTSWTKETTAFSSTPARLLHNEVDVRPYEFVTSTTPALYALKTTPVSWPAGNPGMNKDGDENGFSIVAAQIGDTLNWYTTVSPETVDSIVIDSTGIWSIVVNQVSAKSLLIAGLNRFGSAVWVDTSSTVVFTPATARYTFWVVDPAGNKMRVHKESSETEDAEFVLKNKISVFPNPFNPETVFSISVAEPSTVKLHIFNLIGQQIAEVVNADLNAGVHDYRLNAGSWSSGTYFYRLQIGEKTKTGKIQLVK